MKVETTSFLFPNKGMTLERIDMNIIEGAKVKRHILNEDIGLFNRAPSLHRQSVLAMRAKILESKSLAMNPTICIPFNADYDGDAMKFTLFNQKKQSTKQSD